MKVCAVQNPELDFEQDIFSFCIMLLSWYTASDRIEVWKSILVDSVEAKRKQIKTHSPLGEISE